MCINKPRSKQLELLQVIRHGNEVNFKGPIAAWKPIPNATALTFCIQPLWCLSRNIAAELSQLRHYCQTNMVLTMEVTEYLPTARNGFEWLCNLRVRRNEFKVLENNPGRIWLKGSMHAEMIPRQIMRYVVRTTHSPFYWPLTEKKINKIKCHRWNWRLCNFKVVAVT